MSSDPSCADLLRPLALVVALSVDFEREELRLRLPPPAPPRPAVREPPASPPSAEGARPSSPHRGARVDLAAVGSVGVLPQPALGASVSAAVELGRWLDLAAEGFFLGAGDAQRGDRSAELRAWSLGAAACLRSDRDRRVALLGCVGARAGRVRAAGAGFDVSRDARQALVEAALRLGLRLRVHALFELFASVSATARLTRGDVVYTAPDGIRTLWSAPPLGGLLRIGVAFRSR